MAHPTKHVAKDGSTTWKVRFRHGISADTGRAINTSETFSTKREAEEFSRWLYAFGSQAAIDKLYEVERQAAMPTLDRIAADHIELLTGIEDGTRLSYTRLWARTWSPLLGHIPANRLTRDDVARAVNDLGTRYSHKSLENQRGLLSAVVQRAVEHGHLPKNHAKGIRLPRGQEGDRKEMRILTVDEFDSVVDRIPEHYRPLVRFLFGTGARWGEAVALQVQDIGRPYVDQRGNTFCDVRIRRSLKWSPNNDRRVGATKTRRSNRTVVVGDLMVDDLVALCAGKSGSQLVFTAHKGGEVRHRTFWSRYWLPAVSHLEPRPRVHDLRHSHASWLLGQGIPVNVVQRRLGHESITTTSDTYGHLLPDAQVMAASAAALAFGVRPREIG